MKVEHKIEFQTVGGDLFILDFRNIGRCSINIIGDYLDSMDSETPLELCMEIKPRGSLCVVITGSTMQYINKKYSDYFNNSKSKIVDSNTSEEDSTDILTVVYNYRQEILKLKAIIQDLEESSIFNKLKNIIKLNLKENK